VTESASNASSSIIASHVASISMPAFDAGRCWMSTWVRRSGNRQIQLDTDNYETYSLRWRIRPKFNFFFFGL
jgi:hypothetical protein